MAAAGPWTLTNGARTDLLNGHHDLNTYTYYMALFLSTYTPATATAYSTTNEHATENGYTQGGMSLGSLTLSGTTTVTVDSAVDPTWTAVTGSIVARYAVIYKSAGNVLCYCLLDSDDADVTATVGNDLVVTNNASGVFTFA